MVRSIAYLSSWDEKKRRFEHEVTDYLYKSEFPYQTPHFLETDSLNKIFKINQNSFEVYPRIHGLAGKPGRGDSDDLIELIAKYHKEISGFPNDSTSTNYATNYDPKAHLIESLNNIQNKVNDSNLPEDRIIKENLPLIKEVYDYLITNGKRNNPNIIIHGDFHKGNLIYTQDELTGLIDFGNIKWGSKDMDLSRIASCSPNELERKVPLYRQFNDLSDNEANNIVNESFYHRLNALIWIYNGMKKCPEKKERILNYSVGDLKQLMENHGLLLVK